VPIALAVREIEADAPEPGSAGLEEDAPDALLAVEDVVVFMVPIAAFAGDLCPTENQHRIDRCAKPHGGNDVAKRSKKAKAKPAARRVPGLVIEVVEKAPPKPADFRRARNRLRERANALIIELATRYQAGQGEELTNVLNAMDSADELERMDREGSPLDA
jgi:hypothetical protein